VTIIILSNSYVGFSRLILFVLCGIVYTVILIRLLIFAYDIVRGWFSRVFFTSNEDVVRERFVYARSWYGLCVIAAFLVLAIIGAFVIARSCGWFISLKEIYEWLESPLIYLGQDVKPVTVSSIVRIILFCLDGYVFTILVNCFLLRRVFNLLLIDTDVQNTVVNFTRYLIVIAAIMLGFQMGLDFVIFGYFYGKSRIKPSTRGELAIVFSYNWLIDHGYKVLFNEVE